MNWRKAGWKALLVSMIATFVPGAAHADDPSFTVLNVFGDARQNASNTPWDDTKVLFANSDALGRGEKGFIYVRGNVKGLADSDGMLRGYVEVVVTDDTGTALSKTATVYPVDEPGSGPKAGDFNAEIQVTQLGRHLVDLDQDWKPLVAPDAFPADDAGKLTYLSKLGASPLTVATTARVNGKAITQSQTITKYAGTPRDTVSPALSSQKWPPGQWCHNPELFQGEIGGQGGSLGCGTPRSLHRQQYPDPVNACPDDNDMSILVGPARMTTCSIQVYGATSEAQVSGRIEDMVASSGGIASEIAGARLQIFLGETPMTLRNGQTSMEILGPRSGPRASWGTTLRIDDFEPNTPGESYRIVVTVTDAWARPVITESTTWVLPF
ncbi:MAG: hypothetical protein WDA27_03845 [Actinomycetota bacterium]